ncbi:polymorphic toxin-type HINT domain-containing protein [Kitasatospora sp. NPDC056181]|uniref:polymorphic toxin-type HINT domain-containing protein n=1 Tax=Kitasatospora sp. NPDC056181 TaxID=3345737 RepID=UPI0035DD3400
MREFWTSRVPRWRLATGLVAGGLLAGLLTPPALAADAPPRATTADPDRVAAVAAWQAGGPAVRQAAESALTGSSDDLKKFLASGQAAAADQDLRAQIEELVASSGPGAREAGMAALKGSAADLKAFLDKGAKKAYEDDQRVRLSQIMAAGGPGVKDAAGKAMDGSLVDVNQFLNEGQFKARNDDDRVHLSQLMASGGPEVKKAAGAALDGSMEDVQLFLQYGYQTAAAHDQETLTVSQLADLTTNASAQAGQQAQTAKDAAGKALDATRLAKEASERAAAETKAAQGSAGKASNAAGRAADAATRAAAAAKTASAAAKAANEASRQAANAAADAASAATKAGDAATRALAAAAGAAGNAGQADIARAAAVTARNAAVDARTAGEASAWAGFAATQAGTAAKAAALAGTNAAAAALAALEAADYSGVSAEDAARARQAAARAQAAAAEATRAANATVAIADQAAAAAGDAQRAANDAAAHAEAAATAAEQAAQHAGDANTAAGVAQAAATAADADANSAASSATQAHKVADVARASDAERLAAQQAAEMAAAEEASREADQKAKTAAWESGKTTRFAADTEQLIKDATAAGADPKAAVLKGRQAAFRLLASAGPWTKAAAQSALEGDDDTVRAFLSTDLTTARDYDDRTSVMAIAQTSGKLEKRLAAETASVGTAEQVRAFLATGQYPGKDDDDRVQLSQIMAAGGPGVKEAAGKALDGTIDDVRAFLATGQYKARDDDNRVLVTQALANGGPEVKAAAQAVLSGPADRLVAFLQAGLPTAQQRDAMTAAHVATIASYLATIDGTVAEARQYAAQAAQSYATARGAANEAAGYANQAAQSAQQAQGFAAQAAQSAKEAQASAAQAARSAQQAQASAAAADADARSASASAAMATGYASQASQYAADAKTASDQAQASAAAAAKSRDEAKKAADEARDAFFTKQCTDTLAGQLESQTATVDDQGRIAYVEVDQTGLSSDVVKYNAGPCIAGDFYLGHGDTLLRNVDTKVWHDNGKGQDVCDLPATVKVTGTVYYVMRTCPEPGLSIAACLGKYTVWDTVVVGSTQINDQHDQTIPITYADYKLHYSPEAVRGQALWHAVTDDFVKCYHDPSLHNSACAWAASNFIPYGTLAKGAKSIVAFRYALETGIGIEEAKLAVQATLDSYGKAALAKLTSTADAVAKFRLTLKDGVGTKDALNALRSDRNIDRSLIDQLEGEEAFASVKRASCPTQPGTSNSFPAGTGVLMGDGSVKAIETVRIGDLVAAADPSTGTAGPRAVTNTIDTPDDRDFTELTVRQNDGTQSAVTATDHHPFWVESARTWTDASAVHVGDTLRTDTGATVQVASIRHWTGLEHAYNLTVDGLHTYFVLAGGTPLLVHNANPANLNPFDKCQVILVIGSLGERSGDVGPTTGQALVRQADGKLATVADPIQSGWGGNFQELNTFLMGPESPVQPPANVKIFPGADHAEPKIAWDLADKPEMKGATIEAVINNRRGVCDIPCAVAVSGILYTDQKMLVRWIDKATGELVEVGILQGKRVRKP